MGGRPVAARENNNNNAIILFNVDNCACVYSILKFTLCKLYKDRMSQASSCYSVTSLVAFIKFICIVGVVNE